MSFADDRRAVMTAVLLKRAGHHVLLRVGGRTVDIPDEFPPVELPVEVTVKDGRYELRVYTTSAGGWYFEGDSLEECVGKFIHGRVNLDGEQMLPSGSNG